MKVANHGLRMSNGSIRHFDSDEARERSERYIQALKHGWKPKKTGKAFNSGGNVK